MIKAPPKAPPVGIMPEKLWHEHRMREILQACDRYLADGITPPREWKDELDSLWHTLLYKEYPKP